MACGSGAFPQSSATHFFSVLFDLIGFHFISFDVERGVCSARQPNILSKHFGPQFESMVVPQVLLRIRVLVPVVYKRAEKVCMRCPPAPHCPLCRCVMALSPKIEKASLTEASLGCYQQQIRTPDKRRHVVLEEKEGGGGWVVAIRAGRQRRTLACNVF